MVRAAVRIGRMNDASPQSHCRLVLVTPALGIDVLTQARLTQALSGGDVSSLILPQYQMDDATYEMLLAQWTPIAQEKNVAVISSGELRFAKRHGLDGIHMVAGASEVRHFVENQMDTMIVGATSGVTRHAALEMGEARPDYVFFGKFGGDTHANVHPKYVDLAQWWAQMIEIPAILLAGNDVGSVAEAAATGVDFVALSNAVFGVDIDDPGETVRHANAILANYPLHYET